MKIILSILILFFVTSCADKCDCSYYSYVKVKFLTDEKYVKKTLKMLPTSELEVIDSDKKSAILENWNQHHYTQFPYYNNFKLIENTYVCGENKIKVYHSNHFVVHTTFN